MRTLACICVFFTTKQLVSVNEHTASSDAFATPPQHALGDEPTPKGGGSFKEERCHINGYTGARHPHEIGGTAVAPEGKQFYALCPLTVKPWRRYWLLYGELGDAPWANTYAVGV